MKRQFVLLTLLFVCAMSIMGSASAVDVTNTTGTAYTTGAQVTQDALADKGLGLQTSDSNLLITTAGSATLANNQSTPDGMQAVIDKTQNLKKTGQQITQSQGNLLTINNPNGPLEYIFVSNTNGVLMAKKYTVSAAGIITATTAEAVRLDTGLDQTTFNNNIAALGSDGFAIANIANLWAAGAPADLMATTYTTGNINQGTIDNYAMTKSFVQNYKTGNYYVITHAGGMDDDAAIYGPFGFNEIVYSTSSGSNDETAFINYSYLTDSNKNVIGYDSGTLVLMKKNDAAVLSAYKASTGKTVVSGTLSEIEFNKWLLTQLRTNANFLFTIEYVKTLTADNINYLWYDPALGYGHGIDKAYISALPDAAAWKTVTSVIPTTDYNQMFALGQQAFTSAYTSELFTAADLAAGRVSVTLAPYYVNFQNNISLVGFIDGIVSAGKAALAAAGYTNAEGFTVDNVLQIRNPWTWSSNIPAVFAVVDATSAAAYHQARSVDVLVTKAVKVTTNYSSGSFTQTTTGITDVSPSVIKSSGKVNSIFIPAVAGIMYAWAGNAPYSYIRTISRVGCICSAREYEAAISAMGQFPLGSGGYYMLMALTQFGANGLPSETNRQISARTTAYGVSPSLGTYYSVGRSSDSDYDSILIAWNGATNTGTAALIKFDSSVFDTAMINAGYEYLDAQGKLQSYYAQESTLFWFLDKVWNNGPDAATAAGAFTAARVVNNVDSTFVSNMAAAGQDPIAYILSYVAPVTPVTPVNPVSPVTPSNSGTSTQTNILTGIGATALNAVNGLNSLTTGTSTAASEVAPGLTTSPSTTPAAGKTTSTNNGSNLPLGAAAGAIIIAIAAVLIYLGRNTITGAIKGQKSEKLGK